MTQRRRWVGLRKTYCAVICDRCLEIVGWESSDAALFVFDRRVSKERRRMAIVAEILGS